MHSLSILLAMATTPMAAMSPYVSADLGLSIPRLESNGIDDDDLSSSDFEIDNSAEGEGAMAWSIGGGVLFPLSDALSLDLFANYSSMPFAAKSEESISYAEADMSFNASLEADIDVTTSLIDVGTGMRYAASPQLGLGAAFVYSHVLSSEYDGKLSIESESSYSGSTDTDEESRKVSGDLDEIEQEVGDSAEDPYVEGYKCKPQDFFSVRFQADYAVTPAFSVIAGYSLPLANHLEGKTLSGAVHRATAGIRWSFGAI